MLCPTLRTRGGEGSLREGKEARATGVMHEPRSGLDLNNNHHRVSISHAGRINEQGVHVILLRTCQK